jgi:hypothetical protein
MTYRKHEKINPQHRLLAQLIEVSNSQSQCAKVLGIDKGTVSKWMKDPSTGIGIKSPPGNSGCEVVASVPPHTGQITQGGAQRD